MLNNLVQEYKEYKMQEGLDVNKTVKKYLTFISEGIEYMQLNTIADLDALTYIKIRKDWLLVKQAEGLSNQSLNLRIVAFKSFLGYCKGSKLIKENVANELKRFTVAQKQKVVSTASVEAMLTKAEEIYDEKNDFLSIRNWFMLKLLLATGLRNAELRSIRISDIDFETGEFDVCGKYSKTRGIKFNKEMTTLCKRYLMYRNNIKSEEDFLFVSKSGKALNSDGLTVPFKKIKAAAGVNDDVTPHSFRHKFATSKIEKGFSIEEVAKAMGHTNIQVCYQWYYHPTKKINDIFSDDMPMANVL